MSDDEASLAAEESSVEDGSTDRLLFLSDGVFAIVITLLVLELKVPHPGGSEGHGAVIPPATLGEVLRGLAPLWPSLLGYVLSFVTVAIMWHNHCVLFRYIKRSDYTLMRFNTVLLLLIAFVPFVTALLAEYLILPPAYQQAAVMVYSSVTFGVAVVYNLLWAYASHGNRLLDTSLDPRLFQRVTRRYRFGPLIYFVTIFLPLVSVPLALFITIGLAVFFALPYDGKPHRLQQRLGALFGRTNQ